MFLERRLDHDLLLNTVQSEAKVESFEKLRSITLPADYPNFLLAIGDAGAGPYHGVFPLGRWTMGSN